MPHAAGRFTLAMSDVGEMYFLPVLMKALSRLASGVTLQVMSVSLPNLLGDKDSV